MTSINKKVAKTQRASGQPHQNKNGVSMALASALIGFAGLIAASAAQATVINFDTDAATIFGGADSFTENQFNMTVVDTAGAGGLAGAIIDPSDGSSCSLIACPVGNATHYYAGLNDGALNITSATTNGLQISSLDFAFVAPLGGSLAGKVGQLTLTGILRKNGHVSHAALDFPAQTNGQFSFSNWILSSNFRKAIFSSLSISSCVYDTDGGCYNPSGNQAQFAVDNITVSAIPEPSTCLLLGIGLAGAAFAARRRRPV